MQAETKIPTVHEEPHTIDGFAYENAQASSAAAQATPSPESAQPAPRVLTSEEVSKRMSAVEGTHRNFRDDFVITDAGPAIVQRAKAARVRFTEAIGNKIEKATEASFAVRAVAIAVDAILQKREARIAAKDFRGPGRSSTGNLKDRLRDTFGTGIYS